MNSTEPSHRGASIRASWIPASCVTLTRWVVVLAAALAVGHSAAGVTARMPRPAPGAPRPVSALSGMRCIANTGDAEGYGYREVRFRFITPGPLPGDKQITVRFSASSSSGPRSKQQAAVVAERDAVLPAGVTAAEVVLPTPYFKPWTTVWWDVWVDGVRDPALSLPQANGLPHPRNDQLEHLSVLSLIVGVAAPDVVTQLSLRPSDQLRFSSSSLRDTWSGYTPHDAVVVNVSRLSALKQAEPERFQVLLRWVASGGALWVAGVDSDDYAKLDELIQADQAHSWSTASADRQESPADGWRWVWLSDKQSGPAPRKSVDELIEEKTAADADRHRDDRAWFAEHRYGFGVVVAFLPAAEARRDAGRFAGRRFGSQRGKQAAENNPKQAAAIGHLLENTWTRRHGLAPGAANDEFSNLLVPGVGAAPVIEFQVLITLFAIVAGPINFWLLKRRQKTHLMVLTVPLLAASITLALLLYALLGDGFGTKVRVREVTLLDQPSGQRTTWGRLSYYSALAPSDGFDLPSDCVMYPVLPGWNDLGLAAVSASPREVTWTGEGQRLRGGWLRSRSTTQYLQLLSTPTKKRLEVDVTGDRSVVVNRLGADVEWLLVVDDDSRLLVAQAVDDGDEAELTLAGRQEATRGARVRVMQAEPFPPEGLAGADNLLMVDQEKRVLRKRFRRELGLAYADAAVGENQLNQLLDELTGLTGGEPLRLRPRSYLAFAESAVGVELGIDGARQVGGFHVVVGRW